MGSRRSGSSDKARRQQKKKGSVSAAFCQNNQCQLKCSLYQPSSVAEILSDISRFIAYAAMPKGMYFGGRLRTTKPTVRGTKTPDESPEAAWQKMKGAKP